MTMQARQPVISLTTLAIQGPLKEGTSGGQDGTEGEGREVGGKRKREG
jgi:hypothetical protein